MTISFFRQFKIEIQFRDLKKPVSFVAGFTGPINEQTGMIENLPVVDAWISSALSSLKAMKFADESSALVEFDRLLRLVAKLPIQRTELRPLLSESDFVLEHGVISCLSRSAMQLGDQLCQVTVKRTASSSAQSPKSGSLTLSDLVCKESFTFLNVQD